MRVILSPNPYRDKGLRACLQADRILRSAGAQTRICLPFETDSGFNLPQNVTYHSLEEELPSADILICFGGDGTILHAAKDALENHIPILGVNLGSVGFMADLEVDELSLLSNLCVGRYKLESRIMLDVQLIRDGETVYRDVALNDAVITKGTVGRMVDIEVYADGRLASSFGGDGLVIATPTGSTAYSLAAGGPIVEPTAANILITPVCAHSLHAKTFVLAPERIVEAKLISNTRRTAYLSVDGGKSIRIISGDDVQVKLSEHRVKLVRLTGRSFYEEIHRKLGKL